MSINAIVLLGYSLFMIIVLVVNLLYFFQVFQYRLPGDASIKILSLHTIILVSILTLSAVLLGVF